MVRVLIAGLVAMVIAIVIGPTFIDWLRRTGVGQQIREEGPARHIVKQGTPTMGGLLILATALAPFLALSLYTMPGLALLFGDQLPPEPTRVPLPVVHVWGASIGSVAG